jgi:Phosphate transport (Pho88)
MKLSYKEAESIVFISTAVISFIFKNKISKTVEGHILALRILFALGTTADLLIAFYVKKQVLKHNIKTKVKVPVSDPAAMLKKTAEEKREDDAEDRAEEEVEMTVCEYDMNTINSHISKVTINAIMSGLVHMIMKSPQPLMFQVLDPFKNLLLYPLYIEYVRGKSMVRPFTKNILLDTDRREGKEERKVKKEE